jgi:hypothetical protein
VTQVERALFLTPEHERLLKVFLGGEQLPMGSGNIMNPARPTGGSRQRLALLYPSVRIYAGHFGGWRIPTDPSVSLVHFDSAYQRAAVYFEIVYQGGIAYYERDSANNWILVSASLIWTS